MPSENANEKKKKRLFIAIFPTPEVLASLALAVSKLANDFPPPAIRWTPPPQIHLTLNFLDGIETHRIIDFATTLDALSRQHPPFELIASGVGCFPSLRRPRIVWAGLQGQTDLLAHTKVSLDSVLEKLGYTPEDRPFHPHLTLGRVSELNPRRCETFTSALASFETVHFGQWRARQIDLVESILSPQGAHYSVLQSFPLTGA
jgi:2'-5' RNA ligase